MFVDAGCRVDHPGKSEEEKDTHHFKHGTWLAGKLCNGVKADPDATEQVQSCQHEVVTTLAIQTL